MEITFVKLLGNETPFEWIENGTSNLNIRFLLWRRRAVFLRTIAMAYSTRRCEVSPLQDSSRSIGAKKNGTANCDTVYEIDFSNAVRK